jgi:hypothetical protein
MAMKFKPYKGKKSKLCDAMLGVDPKYKHPVLIRCKNEAVGLYLANDDPFCMGAYLCQGCFEKISEDDKVREPIRQKLREAARQATRDAAGGK